MQLLEPLLQMLIQEYIGDFLHMKHLCTTWYHWFWLGPIWYASFLVLKWVMMTFPIWFPVMMILDSISSVLKRR